MDRKLLAISTVIALHGCITDQNENISREQVNLSNGKTNFQLVREKWGLTDDKTRFLLIGAATHGTNDTLCSEEGNNLVFYKLTNDTLTLYRLAGQVQPPLVYGNMVVKTVPSNNVFMMSMLDKEAYKVHQFCRF